VQDAREDAPDFGATFLAMASDSTFCFPEEPRCDVETINGTEYCLCSDEPFVVVTDPQDPEYWEPNPPPAWPDPPGYPQAGDSPSGPGPGDPCEIGCPLEFEVALSCETGVVRGETGRCELTVEPEELLDHVYGWTFKGKGSGYDGLNAWSSQYHESYWEGPFVASGEVRVDFRVADEFEQSFDVVAVSEFQVVPRDGSEWDWTDDHWEFRPDEAPTAPFVVPHVGGTFLLGANCNFPTCDGDYRVRPDIATSMQQGYTDLQVSDGPNSGLWYVTSASFFMDRQSQVNPEVRPGGTSFQLPTQQATECSAAEMSFYEFNQNCKSINIDAMISGILAHEGFGTGGMENGHEAQAWAEASKAENDILGLAEGAVRGTQIQLVWRLEDLLEDPADRIHDAGAIEPTGNWSGQVWAWDTSSSEYMLLQPWSF
jgi:hypothetical protein